MKKLIWIVPEKRDEEFSEKLFDRFTALAASLNAEDFIFEIKEKYNNEKSPHFHIKVGSDTCVNELTEKSAVNAWYTATADGKAYEGLMRIILQTNKATTFNQVLNSALFAYYDECIREYYPEWKTCYDVIDDPSQASC